MSSFVGKLVARRLAVAIVILAVISVAVFTATEFLPGDVAQVVLGQSATPEAVAGLRAAMHLDQPAYLRYFIWLHGLLTGNPGRSLVNDVPVATLISDRISNSLLLAAVTSAFCVPVALTLGITSAMWRNGIYDRLVSLLTLVRRGRAGILHRHLGCCRFRRASALAAGAVELALDQFRRALFSRLYPASAELELRGHRADGAYDALRRD